MRRVRELRRAARSIQLYRAHTYSVSRALWPVCVRRCVATTRAAQRRRMLIMKSTGCSQAARAPLLYVLYGAVATASLIVSVMMAAFLLHSWALLLIPGVLWLVMIVVTTRLLSYEMSHSLAPVPTSQPARHTEPGLPVPPLLEFPQTPVPATPLIRVLETIDLSASDVEHFIGASPTSPPAQAPQSEAGQPVDAPLREEI